MPVAGQAVGSIVCGGVRASRPGKNRGQAATSRDGYGRQWTFTSQQEIINFGASAACLARHSFVKLRQIGRGRGGMTPDCWASSKLFNMGKMHWRIIMKPSVEVIPTKEVNGAARLIHGPCRVEAMVRSCDRDKCERWAERWMEVGGGRSISSIRWPMRTLAQLCRHGK